MQNEKDDDFGNDWLKTNYAGSGPFKMREWRANEVVVLERNDELRARRRRSPASSTATSRKARRQRLLLEKGDIDVARNLNPEELAALSQERGHQDTSGPKGTVYYISLNQKNPNLAKPEVREAFKYLVDYDAIGDTLIKSIGEIHQNFLPKGLLGADRRQPLQARRRQGQGAAGQGRPDGRLLGDHGHAHDQPVTGIAQAIQQTFAQAGIKMEIMPGDGKQTLTKYRARKHDIYIGQWGSDYWDPNSNADTFAANPDNADDAKAKTLAWRNAWDPGQLTAKTRAAVLERDAAKRAADVQGPAEDGSRRRPVRDLPPADGSGGAAQERRGLQARPDLRHQLSSLRPRRTDRLDGFSSHERGAEGTAVPSAPSLRSVARFVIVAGDHLPRACSR